MIGIILNLNRWGKNLVVPLPMATTREAHLRVYQCVKMIVVNGQIIIPPVLGEPLTLEQRLAQFDPKRHGGEVM